MMTGVVAGGVAFLVAGAFVPLLVRFAVGRNLLDVPNLRSSHEVPTPRLGGVAIFVGMLAGVALLRPEGLWPLLAAAALVWAVGLADDLSNLHFGVKAVLQALAAVDCCFSIRRRSSRTLLECLVPWFSSSGCSGSWP